MAVKKKKTKKTFAEAMKKADAIVDQRSKEFYTMFDDVKPKKKGTKDERISKATKD